MSIEPIKSDLVLDVMKTTEQKEVTIRYHQHNVNSAVLSVTFQNDGVAIDITGAKIRLALVKADKTRVLQSSDDDPTKPSISVIDAATGKVEVTLLTQSLASPGIVYGEFEIEKDRITLVTQMLAFYVSGAILSDDSLQSSNFFPALQKAIAAGETLANVDLQKIVDNTNAINDLKKSIPVIKDSTTNGNITINDSEMQVYDDSALKEELATTVKKVNNVVPDGSGNVDILIPTVDTTNLVTKLELTIGLETKADQTYVDNKISTITSLTLESWTSREIVSIIDEIPPDPISNLIVSAYDAYSVSLTWTRSPSLQDTKDYMIYNGANLIGVSTTTNFTITNLTPSTDYTFTVKTRDTAGNESSGVSISVRTIGNMKLSMNGTTDYLQLPSLTFDSIELVFDMNQPTSSEGYYVDARGAGYSTGYAYRNSAGKDSISWYQTYLNGVTKTTDVPNNGTKNILKLVADKSYTGGMVAFCMSGAHGSKLKGDLYKITVFNSGNIVALYDFTTQFSGTSVPDSSGNGHNATLIGGTWVTQ